MTELFANGARSRLASAINNSQTTMTVLGGHGALFPTFSSLGTDFAWVTIEEGPADNPTAREIVKVTARSTDTFTMVRAQQGTTAQSFTTSARVELRLTAATIDGFELAYGADRRYINGTLSPSLTAESGTDFFAFGTFAGYSIGFSPTVSRPTPTLSGLKGLLIPRTTLGGSSPRMDMTGLTLQVGGLGSFPRWGGSDITIQFVLDADLVNVRRFFGLISNATGPSSGDPSTLTSQIFIGFGTPLSTPVGANWLLYHNNASGTVTQLDTGIPKAVGHLYQARIWSMNNQSNWFCELIDYDTNERYAVVLSTNVPQHGVGLYFFSKADASVSAEFSLVSVWCGTW